jgi:Ca2+-transporting ATPase
VAIYGITLQRGWGQLEARTLTFTTLVIANLGLILSNRTWSSTIITSLRAKNTALWGIVAFTLIFLGVVIYVPSLRNLFHFGMLHPGDLVVCLAAGIATILWFEVIKYISWRKTTFR